MVRESISRMNNGKITKIIVVFGTIKSVVELINLIIEERVILAMWNLQLKGFIQAL